MTNVPFDSRRYAIAPAGAISPNEQHFAIHLKDEIRIYNLPELTIHRSFVIPEISRSAWSWDGQYLGILARDAFIVVNIQDNIRYEYTIARYKFAWIFTTENGWLLMDHEDGDGIDFVYCDLLLTDCQSYATDHTRYDMTTIAPDGRLIITQNKDNNSITEWAFQPDQQYQITQEILPARRLCPSRLSPTGKLLYSDCNIYETIADTNIFTVIHEMPRSRFVEAWLSDRYFLSSWVPEGTVFLHDMEQDTMTQIFHPYETDLVDANALLSTGDLPYYDFVQKIIPDKQGKRFLLNMYFALFLFEVEDPSLRP